MGSATVAFDAASRFDVPIVVTTGPAGARSVWHAATDAFAVFIRPVVAEGARIAVENTGPLRVDLSFVTTLRDTVDLASGVGIDVCVEVNSCWMERDLEATGRGAGPARARAVQRLASSASLWTPDRCVPGDGDIPLARILRALATAGSTAARSRLELVGPRIEPKATRPRSRVRS